MQFIVMLTNASLDVHAYFTIKLAVFTRSPAANESLESFGILQLSSRSTLQSYVGML